MSYTLTTAPVNAFLPILADQRGLGNPGLYFTVLSFVTILSMAAAGPAADRLGRASVIVPGLLLAGAAMFVLAGAVHRAMFLGAACLSGAGFGLIQPGIQSLTVDRVPTRERSSALATLQQAWDVGGSGGAFAMSPIAGALDVAAAFAITGAVATLGALGFVAGNRRKPSAPVGREPAANPTVTASRAAQASSRIADTRSQTAWVISATGSVASSTSQRPGSCRACSRYPCLTRR